MLGKHTISISLAALTPLKHKPSILMTMKTHGPIMQLTLPWMKTLPKASSINPVKMPPRGSEGYDFTPILTHYLFLFTTILAAVSPTPSTRPPLPA